MAGNFGQQSSFRGNEQRESRFSGGGNRGGGNQRGGGGGRGGNRGGFNRGGRGRR